MLSELQTLQALFDPIDCPIAVKNRYLRFAYVNQAFADLYGLDVSDIVGKSANDLFERDVAAGLENRDIEIFETKNGTRQEEKILLADNRPIWFSVLRQLVNLEQDKTFLIEIYTDITTYKESSIEFENQLLVPKKEERELAGELSVHHRTQPVQNATNGRFVLLDVDEEERASFTDLLTELSMDCASCATAEEAFAVMWAAHDEGLKIDGFFVDYKSAEVCEMNIVHFVKSDAILCQVPICLMVHQDYLSKLESRKDLLAVDARILKPVRAQILKRTISKLISTAPEPIISDIADLSEEGEIYLQENVQDGQDTILDTDLGNSLSKCDVLVIVESQAIQISICKILERAGFSSKVLVHADEVFDVIATSNPSIALLDLNMSDVNMPELISTIRRFEDLPIIGLTTALDSQKDKLNRWGLEAYLGKPISPSALITKLVSLTEGAKKQKTA